MAPDDDIRQEFIPTTRKKLLENRVVGGLMVPLAIVITAGLIIFGITKMLSSGTTHRDLVREMQSKAFGNRWIAAFELSKLVAGRGIPMEEIPWLIENLASVYRGTVDHRTRNFIILTFGAIQHPLALPHLERALDDPDENVAFSAVVAVGNLPEGMKINWSKLMDKVNSSDEGIRHAAILALAAKKVKEARPLIESRLHDAAIAVRYAAALALVQYHSKKAIVTVREILSSETHSQFDSKKLQKIRLNLISAIGRAHWTIFADDLQKNCPKN